MAVSAATVWEVRTTGSQSNGGGFVTGASGTDYSQQASAQYALTGVTSAGAGDTVLSASAAADMVGNIGRCVSGTNFTAGWYEVVSVVVGVSITFSTNASGGSICSGVGSSGVINIGGAFLIGGTLDDDFFEAGTSGNKYYIKSGTYTLGESVSIARTGTATSQFTIIGYDSSRDDNPMGGNRPLIACGSFIFTMTNAWCVHNVRFTGSSSTVLTQGAYSDAVNCYALNSSTTANRTAINVWNGGNVSAVYLCEAVSYRGFAYQQGNAGTILIYGCYFHDSVYLYACSSTAQIPVVVNTIFAGGQTRALSSSGTTNGIRCMNCTFYGAESKLGTGVYHTTGNADDFINCIFYGFDTAVLIDTDDNTTLIAYCDFYNNTTDVDGVSKSTFGNLALDPAFANVVERSGSTATTTSGNHLVQTGATFQTWGVVAGDLVLVESGTGVTAGWYSIASVDSETQITTNETLSANATADKVWLIRQGSNFAVGANMANVGAPGAFPGGLTTGYLDIGAAQRQASSGGGNANVLRGSTVAAR